MRVSPSQVTRRWRHARTEILNPAQAKKFRKEVLMLAKAAERASSYTDVGQIVPAVAKWRQAFEYYNAAIRKELEARVREGKSEHIGIPEGGTRPDAAWAQHYIDNANPVWELTYEVGSLPSVPKVTGRGGGSFEEPEAVRTRMVKFWLDRGNTQQEAEREADDYLLRWPAWTREEAEEKAVERWKGESRKWANRVRRKARKTWAFYEDLAAWSLRSVGGARDLAVVVPDEEVVSLEGFRVIFRGFAESPYQDKLPAVKHGLKMYRQLARKRAPILLKRQTPIFIEWTFEPTTSSSAGAYYLGGKIFVTPWKIGKDIGDFVKTMAHEMGHHIFKTYLSGAAKKAWTAFIRGDYKELDLREALATMQRVGARTIIGDELAEEDPILYLQMNTLLHDSRFKHMDLFGVESIQEHLNDGKDPMVAVPINPITGYAGKNPEEAFCEALGMLVAYGKKAVLGPVRMMLRAVLPEVRIASDKAMIKRVAQRKQAERRGAERTNASVGGVVAKFQGKREVPSADGKGTSTVYEYGPGQVAKRHKEKAKRIEALRKQMSELRQQAQGDLTSKDPQTRLTALAVCLMDETYERVGNGKSAEAGHHGVTNWRADHVSLGDKGATIQYTGKSGVKQKKTVTNARVLKALREAMKGKGGGDKILCEGDECDILAKDVNAYLRPFGVTAKDIRGLHANEEMRHHLQEQRKAGPKLPYARKGKDKILKAEFQRALDLAAKAIGHEATTLRGQYLVPTMEEAFVHDGTVVDRLDKTARVKLAGRPLSVSATKSDAEREEEEDQRLVRQSPKKKPPRRDLERGRVEDTQETDADKDQDRKDRSRNFKDAAAWVALRYAAGAAAEAVEDEGGSGGGVGGKFLMFLEEKGSDQMTNPDTGNKVKLKSLKGPRGKELQKREFKKWLDSESGGKGPSGDSSPKPSGAKPKPKPKSDSPSADASHAGSLNVVEGARQKREDLVGEGKPFDVEALKAAIQEEFSAIPGVDPATIKSTLGSMTLVAPEGSYDTPEMLLETAVSNLTKANGGAIKAFDKKTKTVRKKALEQVTALGGAAAKGLDKSLSASALVSVAAHMDAAKDVAVAEILDGRARKDARSQAKFADRVLERIDGDNPPSPKEIAEALVAKRAVEVLSDPTMLYPQKPLTSLSTEPLSFDSPGSEAAYREKMTEAAVDAMYAYRTFPPEDRETHRAGLEKHMAEMSKAGDTETEQYAQALSQMRGLQLASALEDGDKAKGINPAFQAMLIGAEKGGRLEEFAKVNLSGAAEGDGDAQQVFRKVLEGTSHEDLSKMLPEGHPAQASLKLLGGCPSGADPDSQGCKELANLPQDSINKLNQMVQDAVMGEVLFTDQSLVSQDPNASVKTIKKKKKQTLRPGKGSSFADMMSAFLDSIRGGKTASLLSGGVYNFEPWGHVFWEGE